MMTVMIGIPAHNEARNIRRLLEQLLAQNETFFRINRILVVDDGSVDGTSAEVNLVNHSKIKLIQNPTRLGKAKSLNKLYALVTEDVMVQFDADSIIKSRNLLSTLLQPFTKLEPADVVYGNQHPDEPTSFVSKLAYFGFRNWENVKQNIDNCERYNCFGLITAYSRNFLLNYRLPEAGYVTDDTYSFYFAKANQANTTFVKEAIAYFKLPKTMHDYANQMSRYISTRQEMENTFGKELIERYETIKTRHKLLGLWQSFSLQNIPLMCGYLALQAIPKLQNVLTNQRAAWIPIKSTK